MGSVRIGRVNEELMRVLSELIRTVKDPRVEGMISITHASVAPDFGSARVFVSVLGSEEKKKECIKGLKSASGYLRRELAKKMKLRHTPELTFVADSSITEGSHIMELIENVSREEEKKKSLTLSETAEFLKTRSDVLILTHRSPDGDTAGSAAALCMILRAIGKTAYILENEELSKRLLRRVKGFYAPKDFCPKSVITVDVADIKLIQRNAGDYAENIDLAIDHHETHVSFSRREFNCEDSASCGEVVFDIAKELSVRFTKKLCEALYIALATDTGRFLYDSTTPDTHIKAAELISHGIDFAGINREFFTAKSRARIAVESEVLSEMRTYFGGKVSVISLSDAQIEKHKACLDDIESISSLARIAEGTLLGIYLHERDGKIKASLRSGSEVNSAEICRYFGGGGHSGAAGCMLDGDIAEAEKTLISYLEKKKLF